MVESIEELRKICRKGEDPDDKSVSMILGRKLSIYITKLLLYTNITANQTTALGALIGIIAGISMASGNKWYTLLGALLLYLHFIFDLVDGEIARYRKESSVTGVYLERLSHYLVNSFLFFSISFGLYMTFYDVRVFAFGFSASLSQTLISLSHECKLVAVARARLRGHQGYERRLTKDASIEAKKGENYERARLLYEQETYLTSISSTLYRVSRIIYRIFVQPYIMLTILLASLIDVIVPIFGFYSFTLNAMYIILFLHGIFPPLICFGLIFLNVKTRSPDELFSDKF